MSKSRRPQTLAADQQNVKHARIYISGRAPRTNDLSLALEINNKSRGRAAAHIPYPEPCPESPSRARALHTRYFTAVRSVMRHAMWSPGVLVNVPCGPGESRYRVSRARYDSG